MRISRQQPRFSEEHVPPKIPLSGVNEVKKDLHRIAKIDLMRDW